MKISKKFLFDLPINDGNNKMIAFARIGGIGYWQDANKEFHGEFTDFDIDSILMKRMEDGFEFNGLVELITCECRGLSLTDALRSTYVNARGIVPNLSLYRDVYDAVEAHQEYLFFNEQGEMLEFDRADVVEETPYQVIAVAGTYNQLTETKAA